MANNDESIKYTLLKDEGEGDQEGSNIDSKNEENGVVDAEPEEQLTSDCETFWNICNTIQGLPILAIPYAVHNGGWVALFVLLVIAVASNYTAIIIVRCLYDKGSSQRERKRIRDSFVEIGEAFNRHFGGQMVLITQVLELLFISAVYPRMVGRLLAKSIPVGDMSCWVWTLLGGITFIPNVFIKNLSQVAWTSIITVLSAKIIFVTVFAYSVMQYQKWELASLDNFDIHTFPAALGILVASYLSQPFVPVIEGSMRRKDRFNLLTNLSYATMTLLNVVIGFVAYISFQPNIAEVITNNLPQGSFRATINIMAALLAFTSYTLPMFTIFDVLQTAHLPMFQNFLGKKIANVDAFALRILLVSLSVFMAAFIPRFAYLLAFVGSICGICLEFIFPPLFYVKLYFKELKWWELLVNSCVLAIGTFFLLSGIFFSGKSLLFKEDVYIKPLNDTLSITSRVEKRSCFG